MLLCTIFVLFNLPKYGSSSSVAWKIDGLLDIGPEWNYEYTVGPVERSQVDKSNNDIIHADTDSKKQSGNAEITDDIVHVDKIIKHKSLRMEDEDENSQDINSDSTEDENDIKNYKITKINSDTSDSQVMDDIKPIIEYESDIDYSSEILSRTRNDSLKSNDTLKEDAPKIFSTTIGNKEGFDEGDTKNLFEKNKESGTFRVNIASSEYQSKVKKKRIKRTETKTHDDDTIKFELNTVFGDNRRFFFKLRAAKEDPRLTKILVQIYDLSLNYFYELRDNIDNTSLEDIINEAIDSFKYEYETLVEKSKTVVEDTDKALVLAKTIKLVKRFTDDLMTLVVIRDVEINSWLRMQNLYTDAYDKLQDERYVNVCMEFGICRSRQTFRSFLDEFLESITKGDHAKMTTATNTFLNVFGADSNVLANYDMIRTLKTLSPDSRFKTLRALWMSLEQNVKDDNSLFPLPLANGTYTKVKSSALDAIPPTSLHTKLWKKLLINIKSFMNGNFHDATKTLRLLKGHLQKNAPKILNKNVSLHS